MLVPFRQNLSPETEEYVDAIGAAADGIAQSALREQAEQLRAAHAQRTNSQAIDRINATRQSLLVAIRAWRSTPDHEPVLKSVLWAEVSQQEANLVRAARELGVSEREAKEGAARMRQHYCQEAKPESFPGSVVAAAAATDVAIEEDDEAQGPVVTPAPRVASPPSTNGVSRAAVPGPVVKVAG